MSECFSVEQRYYTKIIKGSKEPVAPPAQIKTYKYSGEGISDEQVKAWQAIYQTVSGTIKAIGYNSTLSGKCEAILATHITSLIVFCGVKTEELFIPLKSNEYHITNIFPFKSFVDMYDEAWRIPFTVNDEKLLKSFLETLKGSQEPIVDEEDDEEIQYITMIKIDGTFPKGDDQ